MDAWKLYFVVLLPFCASRKEVKWKLFEKTIGKEPDDTPICSNDTVNYAVLIVCRINMEVSRGEECRLLYRHMQGFEQGCGSRFTLVKINQTVFLHLDNLTPEDSGIYTCECTGPKGTNSLQLNITVEENEDAASSSETHSSKGVIEMVLIGMTAVMIITGVMLVVIYIYICHGRKPEPVIGHVQYSLKSMETELYHAVMKRDGKLYSTVKYADL